jgi:hypothetical protein
MEVGGQFNAPLAINISDMARINLAVVVSLIFFGNILLAIYQRR